MFKKKSFTLLFLCFILISSVFFSGCMTEQEKAEYMQQHTYEYKVVSVQRYLFPITNGWGGVLRYETRYSFSYVDGKGQLYEINDFYHTPYGLWKVCVGEENKYVVQDDGMDSYQWLYLTEETFNRLNN